MAVEAARRGELEAYVPAGIVFDDGVANRTVAAVGADRQRAVEAHGRPQAARPELVAFGGEGIEQAADFGDRPRDTALMDVADAQG